MRNETTFSHITHLYRKVLEETLTAGMTVNPRGMPVRELIGAQFHLEEVDYNLVFLPARKLNYAFSVAEWLWIMLGHSAVDTIAPYNKAIAQFSDDGHDFWGAYGPAVKRQWSHVRRLLNEDPDTRQAVINIYREPVNVKTKDVPCTLSLQFLLRGGKLHAIGTMRSNDIWLGLPYDLFNFTQMQRYLAFLLGVEAGTYTHQVGSLHLYERNVPDVERVLATAHIDFQGLRSPPFTEMPTNFGKVFEGLALVANKGKKEKLIRQVPEQPWQMYLQVLASRFGGTLPEPYAKLVSHESY